MTETTNSLFVLSSTDAVPGGVEYEEPRGDLENVIAQLWRELFRMDKIGRNDNFFELGGNSLLGMDLSEMFASRLALEIPALAIFQNPTIAETAQFIKSQ